MFSKEIEIVISLLQNISNSGVGGSDVDGSVGGCVVAFVVLLVVVVMVLVVMMLVMVWLLWWSWCWWC